MSNVIRYFPTQALNFAFKDSIKRSFPRYNQKTQFWKSFGMNCFSGGLAGSLSLLVVYPLDFIRTRLATDIGKAKSDREFKGMTDVVQKIMKTDGLLGFTEVSAFQLLAFSSTELFISACLTLVKTLSSLTSRTLTSY